MESKGDKVRQILPRTGAAPGASAMEDLHPTWQALIRFCRDLGHGEIERIKIQDGLPVSAEVITKKIRWC